MNKSFASRGQIFIVFAQAAIKAEPSKSSLNDPAPWENDEAFNIIGSSDDFKINPLVAAQSSDPLDQFSTIARIGPNLAKSGETMSQWRQEQFSSITVLNSGRVDHDQQDQADRVDQDMPFAPKDLLAGVITSSEASPVSGLDALTINDRSRRLGISTFFFSYIHPQTVVNLLPGSVNAPSSKVSIDGLPMWIFSGEIAPGAAGSRDIEDRINNLAHISFTVTTTGFSWRNQWFDILQLSVGQVARVELVAHTLMLSEPAEAF